MPDFKHDVAISFLDKDHATAKRVCALLEGRASAWIYSEHQTELVGSNGVAVFSSVFGRDASLVVVLYRDGWGTAGWTAIEKDAIDGRRVSEGSEFVLFVRMDDSPVPPWMPANRIWSRFAQLKLNGLVATIEERLRQLGLAVREETASDVAARMAYERQREDERDRILRERGPEFAKREFAELVKLLKERAPACGAEYIDVGALDIAHVYREDRSLSLFLLPTHRSSGYRHFILLKEWTGRPSIHGFFPGDRLELSQESLGLDLDPVTQIGFWQGKNSPDLRFTTDRLSDYVLRRLLALVAASRDTRNGDGW